MTNLSYLKKTKKFPVLLNLILYSKLKKRITIFNQVNKQKIKKHKTFFIWFFHIISLPRYSLAKMQTKLKNKQIVRYERRTAPVINLRIFSLYSAIMKHGKASLARSILQKVIICLTENTKEHSGCSVLNNVLRFLEPGVGLLVYRRGRNFFSHACAFMAI